MMGIVWYDPVNHALGFTRLWSIYNSNLSLRTLFKGVSLQ